MFAIFSVCIGIHRDGSNTHLPFKYYNEAENNLLLFQSYLRERVVEIEIVTTELIFVMRTKASGLIE